MDYLSVAASLLEPVIELGKFIIPPINQQFNYLFSFNSNIQSLKVEAKKLTNAKDGLQMQVNAAKRNVQEIFPEVETWLANANEIIDLRGIEGDIDEVKKGYFNIKSRFSLSKKVQETTELMKKLQHDCKFSSIFYHGPSGHVPCEQTHEFESRKHIEEEIIVTLRGEKVHLMGICGMAGVGKTTMAKRMMNRVKEEGLFDDVVMVVIGKQVDIFNIQMEIAELLDLKLEVESLAARARKLHARLISNKRILLVLDDVWEKINLEYLGLYNGSDFKGCKVLLTSRDKNVFNAMDVPVIFVVQILSEREAWDLFRDKNETCVDNSDLLLIAENVAKECKGLPIALVTVGRALKHKPVELWVDALEQLRSANPRHIDDVFAKVYSPLKLSYDFLVTPHEKLVFLLCSLFPEDHDIHIEYLTWYLMGLQMFEGIRNLDEARNRVFTLVDTLKSRFLLLDGSRENHVIMHNVVRDVAICIASMEQGIHFNFNSMNLSIEQSYIDRVWISVIPVEGFEFRDGLTFPKLRLLLIDNSDDIEFQMKDDFFLGMKTLNVLSLKSLWVTSLPQTIQMLKNLTTLHLDSCKNLKAISFVGDLPSLEIFSCRSCHWIEELPVSLGSLKQLRLLEFSDCTSLKTIAQGAISGLIRLEELKMLGSFKIWEPEEKGYERRNIALKELESLTNLTCLEIEIKDSTFVAETVRLSYNIVKFEIRIHGKWAKNASTYKKKLFLKFQKEITLGNWIPTFVKSAEFLDLTGDGSNSLNLTEAQNLKSFGLSECSTIKQLVCTRLTVFPVLERLWLCNLSRIEEICNGSISIGSNSFKNLKELTLHCLPSLMHLWGPKQNVSLNNLCFVHIWTCCNLQNLFSLVIATSLVRLEILEIGNCGIMEEIFFSENENETKNGITFPRLKRLSLSYLPRLTTFCKGIERIEFPQLTYMAVHECPNLISLVNTPNSNDTDDYAFHLFCKQKSVFGGLKELYIGSYKNTRMNGLFSSVGVNAWCYQIPVDFFSGLEKLVIDSCENITSLFPSLIAENLVNLKELTIKSCLEMVKVIEDDEKPCKTSLFPKLELLELRDLLKLRSVCEWKCDIEFPLLMHVSINKCPRLENLAPGSLSTPNLETIKIDEQVIQMEDSNSIIQLYFRANDGPHLFISKLSRAKSLLWNHLRMKEKRGKKRKIEDM